MFKKALSIILILLHLATFGPLREALAFTAESASYKLTTGSATLGGIGLFSLGEPVSGSAQSTSYLLNSGFIPTLAANPPQQIQPIPNQTWKENEAKKDAFDLDDYFSSEAPPLTYTVTGQSKIKVEIAADTHLVSFSQPQAFSDKEKIIFTATDSEGNSVESNEVTLLVEGVDNPPVLEYIPDISANENELITIRAKAKDLDDDKVTFTYSEPFKETKRSKEEGFWVNEATWQTDYKSAGPYTIKVSAKDATNLTDEKEIKIIIKNINAKPVLEPITDITVNEGDLVTITPKAADPDEDAISFYYSKPLDETGKWLTTYDDAGTYLASVTASDGTDTVKQEFNLIVKNTNRPPEATLTLDRYTVNPNEQIQITLSGSDPDNDALSFSLKKDNLEIASGKLENTYTTTTSFVSPGDHKIEAQVKDTEGLQVTSLKGVDVVDPNASRELINPVMGDFNGDALSDLGLHDASTGKWEIALSDKGTFRNAEDWLLGFGTSRDWWPMGGDFNGDALTDAAVYNNTPGNGELKIALSNGRGFTSQPAPWLKVDFASYSWQPFTGNFNADKYTDFALYNKDTGEVRVAFGIGTGFGSFNSWLTSSDKDFTASASDFNADSLTDLGLFKKATGEFKVYFSDTSKFTDGSTWISSYATDKDLLLSDFNQDGLTDIGYLDKAGGRWYYASSTGEKFQDKGLWLENFGSANDESASTGDFNGDGLTDAAVFDKENIGIQKWQVKLSTNQPTDLLTEIDNSIGGRTQVVYTYASKFENDLLPFPVYVAKSISLTDTLPLDSPQETYAQDFNYSGGYFDTKEREFRGFNKVKVTDPITKNYTETYFYQGKAGQDGALKGQIEKVMAYDGNNRIISQTLNTYEVRKSGPQERFLGFPALVATTTTVWEENAASLSTKDTFTYDAIGNPLEQASEGDTLKLGDEKSTATTYAAAYEAGLNRPLETSLKDKDGNIVSKKNFEYDSHGSLTKEELQIFDPLTIRSTLSAIRYSYDSFGNLTSTTNALGHSVTTEYETKFYTYPAKVTNSLAHSLTYIYDASLGVVKSVTDANGITSTTTYDSLARVTQVRNGLNQVTVTYSYPDFNTKVTTNALGLAATEFIDGLGRKYKTLSQGEDGDRARKITSEVFYNERGLTEKESLSHYLDEDPEKISYTRYEYDLRGRIKKTIADFPGEGSDAQSSINYISPLYTETTDPQGHRKGILKDIFGNIVEVTEFTSSGVYKTKYAYDIQNNLIQTTDSQGNSTQIFYDSAGRKLKMSDPDMGVWSYEYDILGNLTKQTDAKAQVLVFEYDQLNRLVKKGTVPKSSTVLSEGTIPDVLVTYFYDDSSKENCIGRLSKVTDQSGSTEFFYDKLGREVKSVKGLTPQGSVPEQYVILREYDILDRLTKLTYPDGEAVNYSYDKNSGLLESVKGTVPNSSLLREGTVPYVRDISYNSKGQIKVIKYGNHTQTDYTYGNDLRLAQILTSGPNSTLQNLHYQFDKNGNVTTLTDNLRNNIRTYYYDDLDRLTQANNLPKPGGGYGNFYFRYDSIGNMLYKSDVGMMTYGEGAGPHAVTKAGGVTYKYDLNGNMIQGKNKTLEYDSENRLTKVEELGTITSFTYDGDGGRVKKSVKGTVPDEVTTYIGSLFEIDSSGKTTKHIFAGANRICTIEGSVPNKSTALLEGTDPTKLSYYHSDHLGSSSVITDATGQQVAHYEYTPYGSLALSEGTDSVRHKFTGKELDASTGLYFYSFRYYDPTLGRYTQPDTIIPEPYNPQSFNRYSYCDNNPINYTDPTGHFKFKKFFGKIIGAIAAIAGTIISGGNMMVGFQIFNFFNSLGNAVNTGNWGGFAGGLAGGILGGMAGVSWATSIAKGLGEATYTFGGGFLIGAAEMGAAGFGSGFGETLGSGGSFGEAMKAAP